MPNYGIFAMEIIFFRKNWTFTMINIIKQIAYWQDGSEEDLETAKVLIENKRYLAGLFFCHLCLEKILKALVVKETKNHPPRTHDLERLVVLAKLELDNEQLIFLISMQAFQIEGRYPENFPNPKQRIANNYYQETIKLHLWLKTKL